MGYTLAEKILGGHAGRAAIAGEVVVAHVDFAMIHDARAANALEQLEKLGADVVFVELKSSPRIVEELKRVTGEIDAPCLVNVEELGELGQLTVPELDALGLRLAIYPGLARYAAGYGIREALQALKGEGTTKTARERMLTFREYNEALGISDVEEWERRFLLREQ